MLRSPGRRERVPRPPTPSSSSIPAEAIQLEVQRQLSGILGRLHEAEQENNRLREDLERERLRGVTGDAGATDPNFRASHISACDATRSDSALVATFGHSCAATGTTSDIGAYYFGLIFRTGSDIWGPLLPEPSRGLWGKSSYSSLRP